MYIAVCVKSQQLQDGGEDGNKYRFRDSSLSFDERVKDLLSRLTIKEKAGLMSSHMAAVPRLDIGEWYVGAEVARGYVSRNPR